MGIESFAYHLLKFLHILAAIVGFGTVLLNGLYAAQGRKRPPAEALAISEANLFVNKPAKIAIYLVFLLGFGTVGVSDGFWELTDPWILTSIILVAVSIATSELVLRPRIDAMVEAQRELVAAMSSGPTPDATRTGPPPQVATMQRLGPQIGAITGVLHLSFLVTLVLMVWQPGS